MIGRLVASLIISVSVILCLCVPASGAGTEAPSSLSWTVMVYMANDVSNPLPWEHNINSMEAAPGSEDVDVIALIDNPVDGDSVILKVEHDTGGSASETIVSTVMDDGGLVIPESGEVDMADPATLTSFIGYATAGFPADRLVLVLWGHGAGWRGLCPDKTDLLTLRELGDAMGDVAADLGKKMDMVVVDACAQATVEMLAELRTSVGYFVGAESNIPSLGLPYEGILTALSESPGQSLEEFGSAIVSEYIEFSWYYSPYSVTLAAIDLSKTSATLAMLDEFCAQGVKYGKIFHDVINEAFKSAECYSTEWYVDLVDLLQIVHGSELPLELRTLALQTAISFREALVAFEKYDHPDPYDGVSVERANGAVIYAPTTSLFEAEYLTLTLSTDTNWDEFGTLARLVMPTEPMVPGPSISYRDSDGDGLQDTAFLHWDGDPASVEAWVFSVMPHGVTLRDILTSTTSNISVHGYIGDLVMAASAADSEGSAVSYTTVNARLYGDVRLEFVLMTGDEEVGDDLDVMVVTSEYAGYALPHDDVHAISLSVPTQASVGEMVVVSVMDGEELLLTSRFVMGEDDSRIVLQLHDGGPCPCASDTTMLALSLTPAIILFILAALLYMDHRRSRKDE